MYRDITIENFRGFSKFHMGGLGRVNLLVGTNNSGKSTVLEAIELLSSYANPRSISSVTSRRGERMWSGNNGTPNEEAIIKHLFHGHLVGKGIWFEIHGNHESHEDAFVVECEEVARFNPNQLGSVVPDENAARDQDEEWISQMGLRMRWQSGEKGRQNVFPLTPNGGLLQRELNRFFRHKDEYHSPVQYLSTMALPFDEVARDFDEIVLTPEEQIVIEALNFIEPAIERIAILGSESRISLGGRGNIVLKCKGTNERIPIGTMGDGIWRMLRIAIALVNSKDGILLVDEIDTGLHHSVMHKMWRLVERTAERLNVQVFATTHSRDCYESLATIARETVTDKSQVTIQRIERDKGEAVSYSERDIVIAAERGLEVR